MAATTTKTQPVFESSQVGERVIAALEMLEKTSLEIYVMDVYSNNHAYKLTIAKVKL